MKTWYSKEEIILRRFIKLLTLGLNIFVNFIYEILGNVWKERKRKRRLDWKPLEFTHLPGKNNNISQYLWEYEKGYKVAICRTEKTQKPTKIRLMQTMKGILWQDAGVCHGQQQLTKLRIFSAIANSKKVNYFWQIFKGCKS